MVLMSCDVERSQVVKQLPERRDESRRGTQECVRHALGQAESIGWASLRKLNGIGLQACPTFLSKIQHDPRRSVVAGVVLATHPSVYTAVDEAFAQYRREQKVIEAHALVGAPAVTPVIPERPERPFRLQLPQGVRPALSD